MKRFFAVLLVMVFAGSWVLEAQHLPEGTYRPNRERFYDLIHHATQISIDWEKKQVLGVSTIQLRPLVAASSISLDAFGMTFGSVSEGSAMTPLRFDNNGNSIDIMFDRTIAPSETLVVRIEYTATPTAGLYFVEETRGKEGSPSIFTYGEGGINANWLPLYAAPNDKFSSEMSITVVRPYVAISNGELLETIENEDGTRTFHWYQALPHSDYLLALFVGEYVPVQLPAAFGTIPLTCWVPPGREEEARETFGRTPKMIEFFSERLQYRYPWDKYDQISAYDYAIGAMENTSITGHNDRILRKIGQHEGFNPLFNHYAENWSAEAIISHELAHHWYGDNTTYRSLASLWLNESFATYLMMLWDEHRLGRQDLQFETWLALQAYLAYVDREHIIRPLEYRFYDSRTQIYNTEHTYLKGGIVLNMLRWIVGDDEFFGALSYFLHKHQFQNVESTDLKIAFEEATGRNLGWFFDQWVYGGGHPVFEVTTRYLNSRGLLELHVKQVQSFVEGQGIFTLPADIRIDVGGTRVSERIWIDDDDVYFYFPASAPPDMVSFDGKGALVCDLRFEKDLDQLAYQLEHDELPGQLWALNQLVMRYDGRHEMLKALQGLLKKNVHWSLKAEATRLLQKLHTPDAESLLIAQLKSDDYRIRKAAVVALGNRFTEKARRALRTVISNDRVDDVAATALVSLGHIDGNLKAEDVRSMADRDSWYDVMKVAALTVATSRGEKDFAPLAKSFASQTYNFEVRQQALRAWAACDPTDESLVDALLQAASTEILPVRTAALELLGSLKVEEAIPVLEEIIDKNGDSDIRKAAVDAMDEIARVSRSQQ